MSYSSGYRAPGSWSFDDIPRNEPPRAASSAASSSSQQHTRTFASDAQGAASGSETRPRPRRAHWPPRQCRICLETVQPTFNAASDSLPGFLQSPKVVYQDESGRLIRPCMCKGSSKYVHDSCLQAWRHHDPGYARRNYWQCPTCGFKYRLARLGAGRFIGSFAAQVTLTGIILLVFIFVLGFVADPIIGLYLDPWSYMPWNSWSRPTYGHHDLYDERATWALHFSKGLASVGVLGFLKVIVASPFSYFRFGGGGRRAQTGRERVEQIGWLLILIGTATFLAAVYKGVRAWSRRTLERAGERVMDVQNDDDDDEE